MENYIFGSETGSGYGVACEQALRGALAAGREKDGKLETKARFRRRTFHEPNLIHRIKYMKSSASESIRNACFNLERLSRSFRLAQPGISPLERL